VSGGQAHETTAFTDVIENASIPNDDGDLDIYPAHLAADKGYDAQWIRDWLEAEGIKPVIPHRGTETNTRDADFDRELYRPRGPPQRMPTHLLALRKNRDQLPRNDQNELYHVLLESLLPNRVLKQSLVPFAGSRL